MAADHGSDPDEVHLGTSFAKFGRHGQEGAFEIVDRELGGDRGRRAVGDDLPARHEDHPFTESLHLPHVVGGDQEGGPVAPMDLEQRLPNPGRHVRIEAGGGLVEHQQSWSVEDGLGDRNQSSLAGGELLVALVGELGEAECLDGLLDDGRRLADSGKPGEEGKGLAHREVLGEWQVAGDKADVLHRLRSTVGEAMPGDVDRPRSRGR